MTDTSGLVDELKVPSTRRLWELQKLLKAYRIICAAAKVGIHTHIYIYIHIHIHIYIYMYLVNSKGMGMHGSYTRMLAGPSY